MKNDDPNCANRTTCVPNPVAYVGTERIGTLPPIPPVRTFWRQRGVN